MSPNRRLPPPAPRDFSETLRRRSARSSALRDSHALARGATPAGFWRRFLAYEFDWLLLAPIVLLLLALPLGAAWTEMRGLVGLLEDWMLAKMLAAPQAMPSLSGLLQALLLDTSLLLSVQLALARLSLALAGAALLAAGVAAIYFICFEASRWQATPGKRLLGMIVIGPRGERLRWQRAAARFLAGTLNWLTFNLGHALAGWNADRRALHDLLAGTRVVAHAPMPRWARAILYTQLVLLFALALGLLGRFFWQLAQLAQAGLL